MGDAAGSNIPVTRLGLRNHLRWLWTSLDKRMKLPGCVSRLAVLAGGVAVMLALGGCGNLFVPKQKVLVDAIAAPGIAKFSGQSYRLVARKSVVTSQQAQLPVIAACVNAALTTVG